MNKCLSEPDASGKELRISIATEFHGNKNKKKHLPRKDTEKHGRKNKHLPRNFTEGRISRR
jgi:hypothetical protein